MNLKKVVIAPDNTKAAAFFEKMEKRKAEIKKKIDKLNVFGKPGISKA